MPRPVRLRVSPHLSVPEHSDTPDENLLPATTAAARLGVAPDTLKRMARRGEIASIKYGKLRRFEPSAIRAYIAAHRTERAG